MIDVGNIVNKMLDPIKRRVRLMIGRAVLSTINDASGIQIVQVKLLAGETRDNVERMQNYGYGSVPLPGAEGIMASVSGNRDHGVIIVMDDGRYRMRNLQPGEVAMYSHLDQESHRHHIYLDKDGGITVMAKNVTVKAEDTARIEGDKVHLHARSEYKFDVNGQGQKWDGEGVETWQDDDIPKPHHLHAPPEIP